jgi:hypothetical protein
MDSFLCVVICYILTTVGKICAYPVGKPVN